MNYKIYVYDGILLEWGHWIERGRHTFVIEIDSKVYFLVIYDGVTNEPPPRKEVQRSHNYNCNPVILGQKLSIRTVLSTISYIISSGEINEMYPRPGLTRALDYSSRDSDDYLEELTPEMISKMIEIEEKMNKSGENSID